MRGFILATLLASANGMGDVTSAYVTADNAAHGLDDQGKLVFFGSPQTADPWDKGVCLTGKKQSPINVDTGAATIPAVDPGMPTLLGHDVPQLFSTIATTYALTLFPSGDPTYVAPSQPIILSGGPFSQTRRCVALSLFTVQQLLSAFLPKKICILKILLSSYIFANVIIFAFSPTVNHNIANIAITVDSQPFSITLVNLI